MKQYFSELTEQEKALKKMYLGGGREILSSPLQYAAYRELICEHPEYVDLGDFYEVRTKECRGNTIADVDEIESGEEITVQVHERYGYPILHNHAFIEIAYVYSGECTHFVEDQSFGMRAGDFCILAPDSTHAITALEDDAVIINLLVSKEVLKYSFLEMVKEKRLLAEFFENILYGKSASSYLIFPTGDDLWIKRTILEMYREAKERKYAYRESLELYLRQLFIHVLRNYEMLARVSASAKQQMENDIVFILGYLSVNYRKITLGELAGFFNYSEGHMSRLLKKYTGKTFGALVTELQMKHAAELLAEGKMELSEIAQEVGCFDYSHFSRKFSRHYGESPDIYRKQVRNIHP